MRNVGTGVPVPLDSMENGNILPRTFSGIVCLNEQTGLQSAIREISTEHLTLNHFEPL